MSLPSVDRERAHRVLSLVRPDGRGHVVVSGSELVSLSSGSLPSPDFMTRGGVYVRVAYQDEADGLAAVRRSHRVRLTLRKRPWGFLCGAYAAPLAELAYVMRRHGMHPLFRVVTARGFADVMLSVSLQHSYGRRPVVPLAMSLPGLDDLRGLILLTRLYGRLPDADEFARWFVATRRYAELASPDPSRSSGRPRSSCVLTYAGRRVPPPVFADRSFWAGGCVAFSRVTDPGRRHVRRILLEDMYGETILTVLPHDRVLYALLDGHLARTLQAACVHVLPDGARTPATMLAVAAPPEK